MYQTPKQWQNMEQRELSFIAAGNIKWGSNFEKSLVGSDKTKHTLIIYPAITPLAFFPNKLKTCVHIKTCTGICIRVLFTIDKIGGNQDILYYANG